MEGLGRVICMILELTPEERTSVMNGISLMSNSVVASAAAAAAVDSLSVGTASALEAISSSLGTWFGSA